jgi:sugar transferase EpsL
LGLLLLSPVILAVALAVRVGLGRPILFRQIRPGLNGAPFELIKFRTMRIDSEAGSGVKSDAARLTRLGRFLRSASLDELPELWNVLRGDMSLVGPRPLLMQYLDRYTPEQARRMLVKPGLTGWAQVNGRNALSWEDKFALDNHYVDNQSFWFDIRIILITIGRLVRPSGISAEGTPTMPEFMGYPDGKAPPGRNADRLS